jgi:hypothetical protein
MKRTVLILTAVCLILAAAPSFAQSYYQKEASLYAEIFGNGGEISLNFEKFVGRTASFKVGAGLTGAAFRKGYVIPFGMSLFFGGSRNKIEIGAGGAWIDFDNQGTDRVIFDLKEDQVVTNGVIGFRFIGDYGFTFRLAFTPAYTKDGFEPMGGAILGYAF